MKKILYEAPVDDFMDDAAKENILRAQTRKYQKAKEEGSGNLGQLLSSLPSLENEHKDILIKLAKTIFFSKFPKIKERIDNGNLMFNIELGSNVQPRTTPQKISSEYIKQAKEVDPLFDERVKARNFINATTQGSAWSEGFNFYKEIEKQLNQLNPQLAQKYKDFENAATIYYNDNLESLESMASRASGRIAFTDIVPNPSKPGSWIMSVYAPNFPLLMHELQKGGRYFNSLLYLPKDKIVNNTLTKITDTHKHEIRNMITGREIASKLRFLWSELVDGYETWMDGAIQTQFNKLANDKPILFNEIMYDGVLSGNPKGMEKFEKFSQMIVDAINKNRPKIETPNYDEIVKSQKPIEPEYDDEEEDDDDDDISWMDDIDDED
jgi:hypothetical protein